MCVLTDTHGHPVCDDGHPRTSSMCRRTHTDSHRRHVCAGGHPRTSCVLNRQPTWAKITQTVHGKGQRSESKDQRADMCTDGQPQMSCVCRRTHTDSHRRHVCADRQPRTFCVCWRTPTDVLCVLNRRPTWARITRTVHGKGQCAEFKDCKTRSRPPRPRSMPHVARSTSWPNLLIFALYL